MTSTVGELSVVQTKYKWVIDNFCTGCLKPGEFRRSPTFPTCYGAKKIDWYIKLYPKGDEDSNKDWLSVFLFSCSTTDFKATTTFKILNDKNKVVKRFTPREHIFTKGTGLGTGNFVTRRFIMHPNSQVLTDGKLTMVCELTVNANEEEEDEESDKEETKEVLKNLRAELKQLKDDVKDKEKASARDSLRLKELDELEQLIGETNHSDVELCVEGKTIRAHKCILAKKSPVFAAMFQTEMIEKCENKVEIQDIKYSVFAEMLRYVYSCKVTDIETIAAELLAAADRYSIDGLKTICERTICSSLSVDNAVESLGLTERYHLDELRRKAIDFIANNAKNIIGRPEFQLVDSDVTREILRVVVEKKNKFPCIVGLPRHA